MGVAATAAVQSAVPAASAESCLGGETCQDHRDLGQPPQGQDDGGRACRSALEAAKAVDPERIETELIELADLKLNGNWPPAFPWSRADATISPNWPRS